jgi:hypothetical protein
MPNDGSRSVSRNVKFNYTEHDGQYLTRFHDETERCYRNFTGSLVRIVNSEITGFQHLVVLSIAKQRTAEHFNFRNFEFYSFRVVHIKS